MSPGRRRRPGRVARRHRGAVPRTDLPVGTSDLAPGRHRWIGCRRRSEWSVDRTAPEREPRLDLGMVQEVENEAVEQVWLLHRYDMGCPGDHGELAVWHPPSEFVGVRNGDEVVIADDDQHRCCLLYTSPSPRDGLLS